MYCTERNARNYQTGVAIVLTQRQESNNRNYEFVEETRDEFLCSPDYRTPIVDLAFMRRSGLMIAPFQPALHSRNNARTAA